MGYIKIDDLEKTKIIDMLNQIDSVLLNIEDQLNYAKEILSQDYKRDYYNLSPIREHLVEAHTRIKAALIRTDEFKKDAENLMVSDSGFY